MDIKSQSIIAVDDDVATLDRIRMILDCTHVVLATSHAERARVWLKNDTTVSAILVGHDLKGGKAIELLKDAQGIQPEARRILIASYSDLAGFVEGIHTGAIERTISKPIDMRELLALVRVRRVTSKSEGTANMTVA